MSGVCGRGHYTFEYMAACLHLSQISQPRAILQVSLLSKVVGISCVALEAIPILP